MTDDDNDDDNEDDDNEDDDDEDDDDRACANDGDRFAQTAFQCSAMVRTSHGPSIGLAPSKVAWDIAPASAARNAMSSGGNAF